jgi:metallo-beta-lactamase family protein
MDYSDLNKNMPFNPSEIDYVIVTHNHVDHTGRLPLLVKNGYRGKIHMSNTTTKLIPKALYDSYKVLKNKAKMANEPQLYSEGDVDQTLNLVVGHNFEESFKLDENIKCTFFMNGHLPGAILCLIQIKYRDNSGNYYKDMNVLYTGDYNNKNIFFDVPRLPKWVHQLPISIIQESTYGDMDSSQIKYVFEGNVLNAIKEKKEVIVPVFSLGRAQEIMYILRKLQMNGKLSTDVPIYLDGKLAWSYTNLYLEDGLDNREECKNFKPENFTYVSDFETRNTIMNDGKCKIILTTSGMGNYGPAQTYIPFYLKKSNALIHFTGYCAEGTLGRRLYECQKDEIVDVFGLKIKKSADVQFTSEFSAHAKADELINFLRPFEDIKLVLINHGEAEKKEIYANRVVREIDPKDVGILNRSYFYRINGFGFVKAMSTKFE